MSKIPLGDTSKSQYAGKRLVTDVYVSGKADTPYIIPKLVTFDCSGMKKNCQVCRLAEQQGIDLEIKASSRNILSVLGKADSTVAKQLRAWVGACDDCNMSVMSQQNVEVLRVSPRMDTFLPSSDYVTRECYFLGHGLQSNRPYSLECFCYPEPSTQRAVLVADKATPLRDMIETYDFAKVKGNLEVFRQPPDTLFSALYDDFGANVHRIVGRKSLQIAFDLVFHSVLQFRFQGVELRRGWTEGFVLGDSGQGKTEMSLCLLNHYSLGDRVQGEGSSTAGLIGGLERLGDRWILVWGRIPQMDKRLLIIDEFSGVSEEDVSRLSDIRSTGIAEITKIRTERCSARTRLLMMSNTRDGQPLGSYNTGAEALKAVFGHVEDVRRLDFAICLATSEVDVSKLNATSVAVPHVFTSDKCRDLILWAWSRLPSQVLFADGVERLILTRATELSEVYSSYIPLIEPADTRLKLARLAVACACRCFSSDESGNVVVLSEHVNFVVEFLRTCYNSPYMAYNLYSERAKTETEFSDGEFEGACGELLKLPNWSEIVEVLTSIRNPFRGYEVSERLNIESFEVREIVHLLSKYNMIETLPAGYRKQPKLNAFLRRVKSETQGRVSAVSSRP